MPVTRVGGRILLIMEHWAPLAALTLSVFLSGCANGSQTGSAGPPPTPVPATPTPSPTTTPSPTRLVAAFPPALLGTTWRTIAGRAQGTDPFATVEGLTPPPGVYVLEWPTRDGCPGVLANDSDTWGWGDRPLDMTTGKDLAEIRDDGGKYQAFMLAGCAPWKLALRPVGDYFGPNSTRVGRLLTRLNMLASDWELIDREEVLAEAAQYEALVMSFASTDPALSTAVGHALAEDWHRGSRYILDHPNAARLRRLAILAEVARGLLTGREYVTLFGPIAGYVDPASLQWSEDR